MMEGKENQPQNTTQGPTTVVNTTDPLELINTLNAQDTKPTYDASKFENDDEVKKIRRKPKKGLKEVSSIVDSKDDAKDKIAQIFKKFEELVSETKENHLKYIQQKKSYAKNISERDNFASENAKLKTVNSTLENFYKELQKQSAALIEENKKLQADEKAIRVQLAENFQKRINEVSTQLDQHARDHLQKSKENEILKEKLAEVEEKYQKREELFAEELQKRENHFENHYKDVEDKFKSIEEEANKIEEYNKELEQAKLSEEQTQAKFKALNDKSDAFQVTMTEANEFFTVIKKEMDKMSKKIKDIDNENVQLQRKAEKSDVSIVEMMEEYAKVKREIQKLNDQKHGLLKLIESQEKTLSERNQKLAELQKS